MRRKVIAPSSHNFVVPLKTWLPGGNEWQHQQPARARSRRSAPTTSAASCVRKALLDAREQFAKRRDRRARRCAPSRTTRSATSSRFQEDLGLQGITDGEFRRTYFHIDFLDQLAGRRDQGRHRRRASTAPSGNVDFAPPVMHVTGKCATSQPIQRADFEFLKSVDRAHAEGDHPVAHDAAFPRRPRRHQPRGLSRPRAVLRRRRAGLSRRDRRPCGDAGCTLPAARRHQPRLPVRREDARGRARSAATIPTSCRAATPRSSTPRSPSGPAGMTRLRPPVPRQLQERVGRRGRLRAGGRGAVQRARRRRLLPRVRRRALGRLRAAALRAEGQDRRAGPRQHEASASSRARTTSSAASTRRRSSCRSTSCACRRNAASRAPCTATTSRWNRRRRSSGSWSRPRAKSGAASIKIFQGGNYHVQAFSRDRRARAGRGAGRGTGHGQDRLHPADDRASSSRPASRSPPRSSSTAAERRHGRRQEGRGHHQGRRRACPTTPSASRRS